jgi:hypothetical protein
MLILIFRLSISSNNGFIAAADEANQVLLYGFLPYKGTFLKWDLVGKYRAHHGKCQSGHGWLQEQDSCLVSALHVAFLGARPCRMLPPWV